MIVNKDLQEKILNYIKEKGPSPRKEIAQSLGVSQAIITQVTKYMISKNIIYEKEIGPSTKKGGRKPIYIDINSETGYIMSLDVGSYEIKGGIGNLKGDVLLLDKLRTSLDNTLNQIIEFSERLLNKYRDKLLGISIGLPGVVDIEKGILVFSANLPSINNINFKKIFENKYRVKTFVSNCGIFSLIGVYNHLKKKEKNILNLYWGNSISATFLSEGKEILTGKTKYRIDFGHITIDKNGKLCRCGKRGCIESYVSSEALLNKIKEKINKEIDMDYALKLAREREDIREIFEEAGYVVGKTLSFLIQYFFPDLVVFSGGLIKNAGDILIPSIKNGIKDNMDEKQYEKLNFKVIETEYIGVIGGIEFMINEIFSKHLHLLYQV